MLIGFVLGKAIAISIVVYFHSEGFAPLLLSRADADLALPFPRWGVAGFPGGEVRSSYSAGARGK
jgi:hypothetical protein